MRAALFRLTLLGLASASLLSACADSDSGEVVDTAPNARIIRGKAGALTPPTTAFEATARQFAGDHGIVADQLRTVTSSASLVKFEQVVNGLRVYNGYVKAAFDADGQLVQLVDGTQKISGAIKAPRIDANIALDAAKSELGYATGDAFHRAPNAEEVIYVDDAGVAQRGFVVETWAVAGNQLDMTLVSGEGKIVRVEHRTQNDTYRVYTVSPKPTFDTAASAVNYSGPASWVGTGAQYRNHISGPNVNAYLDTDANNAADANGPAVTDGNFLTSADLTQQPSTTANREAAIQNLFYLNNITHDVLLSHGFDASQNNFEGTDPVLAEAQDGSGTDNANFSTPTSGSPRMQMYLWSGTTPNDVVAVNGTNYGAFGSSFGPAASATGITGALALYNDGTGVASDGCEASTGSLTGKVAIVDRGTCDFTVKVMNAQSAGAVAVVIVNNVAGSAFGPGGTNRKVKIPSAMVTQGDGSTLRGLVASSATLRTNPAPQLQLDGDLDSDIVYHEYGHGLTWRMVGSMSGASAGAIGEGASDVVAFTINQDDLIGEYAYGDYTNGIRRNRYEGYEKARTYSAWTGAEVHDDGEIYAAAMWAVRNNYIADGKLSYFFDDFVHGLASTPSTPTPEQMRDNMMLAAGPRSCLVLKGFAKLGIGSGSSMTISRRGAVTVTQSFTATGCP